MATLFGIGGSANKTDRKQQLQNWGQLSSLFNTAATPGNQLVNSGQQSLGNAINYFQTLASGNRPALSQVLAPQIATINNQALQQKKTLGTFGGNRSGGLNAAQQGISRDALNSVQQLFDLLGPEAAKELGALSIGEIGAGTNLESVAESAAANAGAQASGDRANVAAPTEAAQQGAILSGLFDVASIGVNAATGGAGIGGFGEG